MNKLKIHWRRTAIHTIALVLCICGGALQTATAVGSQQTICAEIEARQSAALQQVDKAGVQLRTVWKAQDQRQQVLFDQMQTAMTARDQQLDAARATNHTKLAERAHDTAQKEALASYRKQLHLAIQTRRDSVADAVRAFKEQLLTSTTERRAMLAGQTQAYRIAVNDAYTKAQGLCAAAAAPSEVSAELTALVTKSQATYDKQRADDKGLESDVRAFATVRERAIHSANSVFMTQAEAALRQLETTFGRSEQ